MHIKKEPMKKKLKLLEADPYLAPYENALLNRIKRRKETEKRLCKNGRTLLEFASGHEYFGLHQENNGWVFREWAPNATAIFLAGDMTGWEEKEEFSLHRINTEGVWEIRMNRETLKHGMHYRIRIHWDHGHGDRIPAYARRVVQDPRTLIFTAQVWAPENPHVWKHSRPERRPEDPLLIYESHVGMAQEEERIGTYREFADHLLERIKACGYNTVQLMAIHEHPYYASFGYQVSSFFAASSRFGTPEDLKYLVDKAHGMGLFVIMDLVHSHAVMNETEGLSRFDGTPYQYFHEGDRGTHIAWNSRLFDYGKPETLHFLLSNIRFWLDAYQMDGFRFDGVTSMLYLHHGLEKAFTTYEDYFDDSVDEDACTYLALANKVAHGAYPECICIAEDISGMPGLAFPAEAGGAGFDYRFAMGVPDYWIKLAKDIKDENWPMGGLWHELTNKRREERSISYAESHDQALVGDQTLIFRLIGKEIYEHMRVDDENMHVDRGIQLHKMIRWITLATADSGYLNFMGNEFGHPEWIDFPREGNHWSYRYARRQWHLADDPMLRYSQLGAFDGKMLEHARKTGFFREKNIELVWEHDADKVLIFMRKDTLFAFNFHPVQSYTNYGFCAPAGKYRRTLDTDQKEFGGHARLEPDVVHQSLKEETGNRHMLYLYLPSRTAQAFSHLSMPEE